MYKILMEAIENHNVKISISGRINIFNHGQKSVFTLEKGKKNIGY